MLDVMRELGCDARLVGLYFTSALGEPASHAAVEVAWGARWHYVDVTNGAFFRRPGAPGPDLLSITELLGIKNARRLAVANGSKADLQMTLEFIGDPLDYLASDPDVVIDGEGAVRLRAKHVGDRLVYKMTDVPNYVGRTQASSGGYGSLRLILPVAQPIEGIDIAMAGVACADGVLRARSHVDCWESPITMGMTSVSLPVRAMLGDVELSAEVPTDAVGYIVLESVSARCTQAR